MLACYGPARVVSSPAERCLATVRPYAALAGVPVEAEPAFLPGTPAAVMRDRITALATAGQPLRKAAFWALQLGQGHLISAEQHSLES